MDEKFAVSLNFGPEFILIVHVQREVREYFCSVCGSQTKLKIIPNRKPTVFIDARRDTNNLCNVLDTVV